MCEDCKNNTGIESDDIQEQLLELTSPEEQKLTFFFEPCKIPLDNLATDKNIKIDNAEFTRGLKDSSYFSGLYTGFVNIGISVEDAVSLILNKMNIEHNIECSKINANASIESAKNMVVAREKEML